MASTVDNFFVGTVIDIRYLLEYARGGRGYVQESDCGDRGNVMRCDEREELYSDYGRRVVTLGCEGRGYVFDGCSIEQ